jgi:ankyrin repeat protein
MKRINDRLSSKEERLWHAVKHGDDRRIKQIFNDQKEDEKAANDPNKKKISDSNVTAKNKIDINKKDKRGMSSLVVAIDSGRYEIAKTLILEQNADVNSRYGKDSNTALHLACIKASENSDPDKQVEYNKMIGLLLKHGADPNALNKNLLTPIAFTNGRQKDE